MDAEVDNVLQCREDFVGSLKSFEEIYSYTLGDSGAKKQENSFKPNKSQHTHTHTQSGVNQRHSSCKVAYCLSD